MPTFGYIRLQYGQSNSMTGNLVEHAAISSRQKTAKSRWHEVEWRFSHAIQSVRVISLQAPPPLRYSEETHFASALIVFIFSSLSLIFCFGYRLRWLSVIFWAHVGPYCSLSYQVYIMRSTCRPRRFHSHENFSFLPSVLHSRPKTYLSRKTYSRHTGWAKKTGPLYIFPNI